MPMTTFLKPLGSRLLLCLFLGACSSSAALAEQIADADNGGKYPKLDRSSDIAGPDVNHSGMRDDIEAWISGLGLPDP